jgi:hypothetical protein
MKSIKLLIILFITVTIIYLVLYKICYIPEYNQYEHFYTVDNNIPRNEIANKLNIDVNRIHNYVEKGDVNDTTQFSIEFDIYPRTLAKSNNPSIKQIEEQLNNIINNKEIMKIQTSTGVLGYFKNIKIKSVDINKQNQEIKRNEEAEFVNPELEPGIKYLESQQKGFKKEASIEPRYKFNRKGELELEPLPSRNPTLSTTPTTSRTPRTAANSTTPTTPRTPRTAANSTIPTIPRTSFLPRTFSSPLRL